MDIAFLVELALVVVVIALRVRPVWPRTRTPGETPKRLIPGSTSSRSSASRRRCVKLWLHEARVFSCQSLETADGLADLGKLELRDQTKRSLRRRPRPSPPPPRPSPARGEEEAMQGSLFEDEAP